MLGNVQVDVVIYGATPAGIGAAIAAARRGRQTLLLEPSAYIGGLMTSGLGETDIRSVDSSGSIFGEFLALIYEDYVQRYGEQSEQVRMCNRGLRFEPSVAKRVMWKLLRSTPGLEVVCSRELYAVWRKDEMIDCIGVTSVEDGAQMTIEAKQYIDATYEGDLAAMSGVPYELGRESRDVWNEELAGKLYCEYRTKEIMTGSTGEGDGLLQAYNFRLCMTRNPDNRVPFTKPEGYNREEYVSLLDDMATGRIVSYGEVIKLSRIPNGKTDTNNHHNCSCSTDLPGENLDYPEGDRATRKRIALRHKRYIQGLLWFLQDDPAVPESIRAEGREWGYAADEFEDSDHFPPQLYVREARRIEGRYVFTENDARLAPGLDRSPIHFDSIATGDYAIDSHATRKREAIGQNRALEGFLGFTKLTEVYQIPLGVIVPETVNNLTVPVAVSATHMGFGTIRMEPFWMQIGFAAGIAADLCQSGGTSVQEIDVDRLQDELIASRQVITYFRDVPAAHPAHQALQYFGTKGYFTGYSAEPDAPCTVADASLWIARARSLAGGGRLPMLPATDKIRPAGEDIGPRALASEAPYREYWSGKPLLQRLMARRWLDAAARALRLESVSGFYGEETPVSRGELLSALYDLLKQARSMRGRAEAARAGQVEQPAVRQ